MKGTCDICGEHSYLVVVCRECTVGACERCEDEFAICQCDRNVLGEQAYRIWSVQRKIDLVNAYTGYEYMGDKKLD